MRKVLFKILIGCCFLLTQCKKPGCFENAGTVTTTDRILQPYNKIYLNDDLNLILTQSEEFAVKVNAGQNLQPNITTIVKDSTLIIENTTSCDWLRNPNETINVSVSIPNLKRIDYDGSGSITSTNTILADTIMIYSYLGAGNIDLNLNAKHTTVHLQGQNADVTLHGKSDYCYTLIHPRSSIYLSDFEVKNMDMVYVGVRDAFVNVTNTLNAYVCHLGNIYYKGNPNTVVPTYFSSGRLIKAP
ncbi:head GIN domain-containing protein [Flavisolibacter tropicus]|nr:head GIN domain-containing protein [Flavisolibacter tropicus]